MNFKKYLQIYAILNIIFILLGANYCRNNDFSPLFFVIFIAVPCTIAFILFAQFFSITAISRFKSRMMSLSVQCLIDFAWAITFTSVLFLCIVIGKKYFHFYMNEFESVSIVDYYIRYVIAVIQLGLLGKIFSYSNIRFINQWGQLVAFTICILELDWIFRMSRYSLPFLPKIVFGWAIMERTWGGYIGAIVIIVLMTILLRWEVKRKEFI